MKRRWTTSGHRPQTPVRIGYEFGYLYLALCPYTGWLFAMLLPYANTATFKLFCEQLATELTQPTLLVADRASFHQASSDERLRLVHLPTACPDLNPPGRRRGGAFFQRSAQRVVQPGIYEFIRRLRGCREGGQPI